VLFAVLVAVVVGAVVVARSSDGGTSSGRVALSGFGDVAYQVERSGRTVKTGCALLAATKAQQERGLMNVRHLTGYDGMIFQFSADTTVGFYMKDTPMPLSIAWFDAGGGFVSGTDMAPNNDTIDYYATAPYRYAFEVPQGKLGAAGIGAGSTLVVGGRC
jgi:uncharacterized membrane protein (UPF0127 family)